MAQQDIQISVPIIGVGSSPVAYADQILDEGTNMTLDEVAKKSVAYGPYASVAAAHTALSDAGLNTVGTTVGISGSNNTVVEYWYQGGTAQANLVEKSSGGGGSEQIQSDWNQTDRTKKDYIKNKPTIPAAQIQSDWDQTDNTKNDFIKNKPNIPDTSNYYTKSQSDEKYQPKGNYQPAGNYATKTELNGKVDKVSGKGLSTNDYTNEEKQKVGNALVPTDIAGKANASDVYTKSETYTKTEVNGLVDTPHQEYVTVDVYSNLPATGSKDTIYRVSNYNGSTSQVDASVYSEYAWNGTQYIFLCVKSQIGEVFDVSVYNNNAKYANLAAALNGGANIPQSLQKGGMSVKFVQSSDNKYVQFRYMGISTAAANFTNTANWQGVTSEIKFGSKDLVESGGAYNNIAEQEQKNIIVSWDNMMPFNGWIGNNAFQLNGGKHSVIPVKGGDVITVMSKSPAFMFYIVKSYHIPTSEDLTVDFATGETARRDAGNRELTITLPSDAKYLVCTYTDLSNISRKPKYLFINGIDILNNTTDEIDTVLVNGISANIGGTVIAQIDKITLAALNKKFFMRKYDGAANFYPELHFPKNTIFDIAGIKIVEDNGNFYLANKVAVLDGIISAITGKTPYKLYWHKTQGLVIKGGIDESSQEMLVLSLRGNETFLYNGYTYIVTNGVLTKIGQGDSDTDYVENAMSIIQEYNEGKNLINFAFMTDTHSTNSVWNGGVPNMTFPGKSIDIMGKLSTQNLIDCCIHGGDVLTTFGAKTSFPKSKLVIAVRENAAFYKESIPGLIFVKGNHDNGHNDDAAYDLTNAEWKSYFQSSGNIPANAVWGTEQDACYYYFDNDAKKVRIIVVDSWYEPFNSDTMSFGSEQEDWFYNTALHITGKTDNTGWCVLVVSHLWGYSNSTIEQNPLSANMNNILRAFQNKGTQYGNYIFDASIDTKLVAVVMGHEHQDMYNNSQGYNTIRVTRGFASCNQVGMNSEMPAVDIFTIDTESNVLYETRIGRGNSRSYTFGSNPHQIN